MSLIQLTTTDRFEKFYLQADLIQEIYQTRTHQSEIVLTNGKRVSCSESPDKIKKLVEDIEHE